MRVGLYGPMANAGYTLARGLHAAGYDVEYVHEPQDRYPMSQPMWEDAPMTFEPSRLPYDVPTAEEWDEIGHAHGWERPPWIVDAPASTRSELSLRQRLRATRLALAAHRSRPELREHVATHAGRISTFGRYDWLVVSGVRVVDAYLSAARYTFWPNGGDLSIVPFCDSTPHERFEAAAVRAAIRGASICGTHDPLLADSFGKLGVDEVRFLPFLVDTERYAPRPSAQLGDIAREVSERAAGRKTLLVAARQDVRWKGTDRFARAFARAIREGADLFLVLTPWGDDQGEVAAALRGLPEDAVYELPGIASKPVLVDLYSVADAVVDQFTLGVHGSTMLEALACETTVLIRLDVERFTQRWPSWAPPPVVNVSSEDEILAALLSIASGELDVGELGRAGRAWAQEVHGVHHAHRFLHGS